MSTYHRYPYPAVATTRRVWAAVSASPQATCRAMACELGLGYATVNKALHALRDAGYIAFEHGGIRARTIIVPFGIITKEPQ